MLIHIHEPPIIHTSNRHENPPDILETSLTLLLPGCRTNDNPRGGSLGPRSYFQLIWTSFWTHGTIIDQFIVKGGHQ